jgi:putative endonuclease
MVKGGYTYILTNKPFGILYGGVTADLPARITAHRKGQGSSFVRKWQLHRLVLIEAHDRIEEAIAREKALKNWNRIWKLRLISESNPNWNDLFETING